VESLQGRASRRRERILPHTTVENGTGTKAEVGDGRAAHASIESASGAGPRSGTWRWHSRTRSCRKQGAAGDLNLRRCFGTQRASRRDQPNSTWFLRPYDYFEWE